MQDSWQFYKQNFIRSYGQVIDPNRNDLTTSEGQSYAMLRAVEMNDQATFDGVWEWTQDHLQHRLGDQLFSWKWAEQANGKYKLADSNTASDADEDIALALLRAHDKWGDKKYLTSAKIVINNIWKEEVVSFNGRYYLAFAADGIGGNRVMINPSYLAPYSYKEFAKVDAKHDWRKLADDSYYLLKKLQNESQSRLIKDWVIINAQGELKSAVPVIGHTADQYGYDAFRINWRLALDARKNNDNRAKQILHKLSQFYAREWRQNEEIMAVYDMDGKPVVDYGDIGPYAGAIMGLEASGKNSLASEIYKKKIAQEYKVKEGYWGDKRNYYNQNWAWFVVNFLR